MKYTDSELKLSPKVEAMYQAVLDLIREGNDVSKIKVIDITTRAGIGKGTAYEYFRSREEIIGKALIYYREKWKNEIQTHVAEIDHFIDKMRYIFQIIDHNSVGGRRLFFLQVAYIMHESDKSEELKQIKDILKAHNADCSVAGVHMDYLSDIIVTAQKKGEITAEYPLEYIKCSINGKLLGYLMHCMHSETVDMKCKNDEMAEMLLKSIENEFCNMRG
ncbi:MAG: TetR/AcrR family transcriptional regulator [Lachnospiraceae bacterium]|nr:TetR/AcrR family transcriptional regulator [Lachnospiraceae bacterium]